MFRSELGSDFKPGFAVFLGFMLAAVLLFLPTLWTDSRVIQRTAVAGQVVWATPPPVNTGIIRTGLEIEYVVQLADGERIRLLDSTAYRVGSQVVIDRAIRENGSRLHTFSRRADR
jgi:hypothetical protein